NPTQSQQNTSPFQQANKTDNKSYTNPIQTKQTTKLTFNQTNKSLNTLIKTKINNTTQITSINQNITHFSSTSNIKINKITDI
ncbi:hypothetical protein, partial [Klebsiella pneumoniae]|uniref:hypothetical protein n=1 Tax=Klebsiella pneumoniae TaxID=573 RepID=UPI003B5CF874